MRWESVLDALLQESIRFRTILSAYELQREKLSTDQEAAANQTFIDAKKNFVESHREKAILAKTFGSKPSGTTPN